MKSRKEVIARGPTGSEGERITPTEPPWAGGAQRAAPLKKGRGRTTGPSGVFTRPSDFPRGEGGGGKEARFSGKTKPQRLTSGTFCLLPHPVPRTLSPRDKFLGRRAGECFLEKLHGHPPVPQKRLPSSENQEVSSQQNYIQRRQKAPPRFQRYFRMLYSETWSDS